MFLAPAFAADNNENQYMCVNYIWNCDNNYSGCTVNAGYDWTSNGYPNGAGNPSCCGDDSLEFFNDRKTDKACSGNNCPSFNRSSGDVACCPDFGTGDYCVYNGNCYDYTDTLVVNGSREFCETTSLYGTPGTWIDPDTMRLGGGEDLLMCEYMSGMNPANSAESGVGEYDSVGALECCGDDSGEYIVYACPGVSGVSGKCCNSSGDKINASGNCVSSCPIPNTAPSTPTNLSQSPGSEGSWTNDSTPYFDFTISDPNSGDTVGYLIQIDDSSGFTSLVGWYDWSGSTTNPNNVRYTVPSTADLSDGSYYWRVRAEDVAGLTSNWADDSNGFAGSGIDFKIDTVNPVC